MSNYGISIWITPMCGSETSTYGFPVRSIPVRFVPVRYRLVPEIFSSGTETRTELGKFWNLPVLVFTGPVRSVRLNFFFNRAVTSRWVTASGPPQRLVEEKLIQ